MIVRVMCMYTVTCQIVPAYSDDAFEKIKCVTCKHEILLLYYIGL